MASMMLSRSRSGGAFATRARIRLITPPARLPALIMRSPDPRAAFRLGVSPASQRRQALPLLTSPVSGWLTSWAIAAVSSPRVVTRATRTSSARACSSSASVRLRLVRSRIMPTKIDSPSCLASPTERLSERVHLLRVNAKSFSDISSPAPGFDPDAANPPAFVPPHNGRMPIIVDRATEIYRSITLECERQRQRLGWKMWQVDDAAGLQDGHYAKLLHADRLSGRCARWET